MTPTVTLPDETANRFVALPPSERDALITDALSGGWDAEDDRRLAEEAAIERGIAGFEAGETMSHKAFTAKWNEFRAQASAQ